MLSPRPNVLSLPRCVSMWRIAFTAVRATWVMLDEPGQPVFKRALWLIVLGERRGELSLLEARQADG